MAQQEIEVILTRQLASYLAIPMFIVDPSGNLLFFNEPAEAILGRRFEETEDMSGIAWATMWHPTAADGSPLPAECLPLAIALTQVRPARDLFWIQGLDGARRYIEVIAFPLIGQSDRRLGAVAMFWEQAQP